MTDPDIVSTITEQSEDEEEERNSMYINHSVQHFAVVCLSMELSVLPSYSCMKNLNHHEEKCQHLSKTNKQTNSTDCFLKSLQ
jgi:hypothetical protein